MPRTKLDPRTAARGGDPHDFSAPREGWELSVFDGAEHFAIVEMRGERRRTEFRVLPWAIRHARNRDDRCLYAVCESGRFALLDRARWDDWLARWREARGIRPAAPEGKPTDVPKPHLGTIADWEKRSSPLGLGYCVSGRIGARSVLTTSILARSGDEVETLNWRYTLGEEGK